MGDLGEGSEVTRVQNLRRHWLSASCWFRAHILNSPWGSASLTEHSSHLLASALPVSAYFVNHSSESHLNSNWDVTCHTDCIQSTLPFQKHYQIHISLALHATLRGKWEGDNSILPMETRKVKNLVQGHTAKWQQTKLSSADSSDHHPQVFPWYHPHRKHGKTSKKKKKITHIYQGKKWISEVNLVHIFISRIK